MRPTASDWGENLRSWNTNLLTSNDCRLDESVIRQAEDYIALLESDDVHEPSPYDEAAEEVWLDIITRFPQAHRAVAHNKTTSETVNRKLYSVGDESVRSWLARVRRTPPDLLVAMASDPSSAVGAALTYHPKLPPEALARLLRHESEFVRGRANERVQRDAASANE